MKTIHITHQGRMVHIPVSTPKARQTASSEATGPSFSLPMQDALRRFGRGAFGLSEMDERQFHHTSLLFDDDEAYADWIRRHHPENMPYGED